MNRPSTDAAFVVNTNKDGIRVAGDESTLRRFGTRLTPERERIEYGNIIYENPSVEELEEVARKEGISYSITNATVDDTLPRKQWSPDVEIRFAVSCENRWRDKYKVHAWDDEELCGATRDDPNVTSSHE